MVTPGARVDMGVPLPYGSSTGWSQLFFPSFFQCMAGGSDAASKAWSAVLQSLCCSSSGAAPSAATGSLLAKVRGRLGQPSPLQSGLKDAYPEQGASDGAWLQDCLERGPGTVKGCAQGLAHMQFSAAWHLAGFSTDFANVSKLFILLF